MKVNNAHAEIVERGERVRKIDEMYCLDKAALATFEEDPKKTWREQETGEEKENKNKNKTIY